MKVNKYIGWSLGLMALFSGCADNDFSDPYRPWDGEVPDELNFIVNVADPDLVRVGDTRADDGTINSLTVMQYDKDGHYIDKFTPVVTKEGGKYKINVKLDKAVSSLQFAANHTVSSQCKDLSGEEVSDALPKNDSELAAWYPVLWGNVKLSDVLTSADRYEPEIILYRNVAKVSVSSSAENFKFKGFSVYYTAEKGTVAPSLANHTASKPTEASGIAYTAAAENLGTSGVAYVYETAKETSSNTPKVVIEGELDGKTYYYVAGFRNRTGSGPSDNPDNGKYTYTPLDILRNHHYAFEITSVRGEGWPTLEAAKDAQPDNRLTVWVSDINEEINNMVSSRDYMLGVKDKVNAKYDGAAEITVVCSYPNIATDPVKISLVDATTSWIKVGNVEKKTETSSTDAVSGKTVKKIVYTIPLDKNDKQTMDRVGSVIVRVGDLSREVEITQEGRSLRRDRGATIYGLTGVTDGTPYYTWVDNNCKGLKPEENRGLERNNALIFAAVPVYGTEGIWYKIPKEFPGEEGLDVSYELDNKTDFEVTEDGNEWVVKAKDNSKPKIASGKLTLHASNGAVIDYELLQVGFFHELTSEHISKYAKGDNIKSGWHYYEVVKIGNYYLLDRNFGASSNCSYDPTNINYSDEDANAIGGYFVVNPVRAEGEAVNTTDAAKRYMDLKTVTEYVGLKYSTGKFHIPSEAELRNIGLTPGNHGAGAMSLNVDASSQVAGDCIYIPAAGYYFGSTPKSTLHGNVWTRTLLGGSQGLMETDDEYGTQYRYLDFYGGYVSYGNLRTSAGAEGKVNDKLRNYVPIRLIWRGNGDKLDGSDGEVIVPVLPSNYTYTIWGEIVNGNGWSETALVEEDGKWVLKVNGSKEVALKKGAFGIRAKENNVQKQWIVGYSTAYKVNINGETQCYIKEVIGDNAHDLTLESEGTYTLTFDPSTFILTVNKVGGGDNPSNFRYGIKGSIFGNPNWSIEHMSKQSDGTWVLKKTINEGMFGVIVMPLDSENQEGWYNNSNLTLKTEDVTVTVGNGNNYNISAGTYTFTFDPSAMTLTVVKESGSTPEPDPIPDNVKVMNTPGEANGWNIEDSMKLFSGDDGKTYQGMVYLKNEFKFHDGSKWIGDKDGKLEVSGGNNMRRDEGYYWIYLNFNDNTYTISNKIEKISVTGENFGWGNDVDLTPNDNKTIWTGTVNFGSEINKEWKLRANGEWNTGWAGSVSNLSSVAEGNLPGTWTGTKKVTVNFSTYPFKVTAE